MSSSNVTFGYNRYKMAVISQKHDRKCDLRPAGKRSSVVLSGKVGRLPFRRMRIPSLLVHSIIFLLILCNILIIKALFTIRYLGTSLLLYFILNEKDGNCQWCRRRREPKTESDYRGGTVIRTLCPSYIMLIVFILFCLPLMHSPEFLFTFYFYFFHPRSFTTSGFYPFVVWRWKFLTDSSRRQPRLCISSRLVFAALLPNLIPQFY